MRIGIGEPESREWVERRLCGFKSSLPEQAGEKCVRSATLHLLVKHRDYGTLHLLLECGEHYLVAVQTGELVADHEIGPWCGVPDTVFDQGLGICVPDDSDVQRPAVEVRGDHGRLPRRRATNRDRRVHLRDDAGRLTPRPEHLHTALLVMALLMLAECES